MSGGQAQRVAIARALVIEPAVVFADEPTGSLDSLAGEHVMELLTGAAIEHGAAVVLVTHEARVAAYAHREVIVRDGRHQRGGPDVTRLGLRLALSRGSRRDRRTRPHHARGRDRDRDPPVRTLVPARRSTTEASAARGEPTSCSRPAAPRTTRPCS